MDSRHSDGSLPPEPRAVVLHNVNDFPNAMNYSRRTNFLLALVLMALLAGCGVAPIKPDQQLTGQEGAVIFRLINNSANPLDPAETLSTVRVRKLKSAAYPVDANPEFFTLVRTQKSTHSTAVFSGLVPPGRYALANAIGGQGNTTYTFPLETMLSQFEVKAQQVTLLGTLVIQPLEGKNFNVGYVPPDSEMQATYEQLFPSMAEQNKGRAFLSMETTDLMLRRAELALRFKRLSKAVNGFFQSDRGDFFYGSKLGTAYWKKSGERSWRFVDLGTWREVLTLKPIGNALVAAGEDGLLLRSTDEGRTWSAITPPERGAIYALVPLENGRVIAMVKRDSRWNIYSSTNLLLGRWEPMNSFDHETSINIPWHRSAHIVATPSWVGAMMPNGVLHAVNLQTNAVERRANTSFSVWDMTSLGGSSLLMKGVRFATAYFVSDDFGQSWQELPLSRFTVAVAAKDRNTLYAVSADGSGLTAGPYQLRASRDGGRTWQETGSPPPGSLWTIRQMVVNRNDGSLLAMFIDGTQKRSTDEGKTWNDFD